MNIALTFSGGGYRAAAFHLGTLSMLHHVKTETGTLLEHVEVLSTVSGGTLTGLRYMQALTKGEDIDEMTRSIYKFFFDVDMMTMALQQLDDKNPQEGASAIRTMVDIYDEKLFGHATFADFIDKMGDLPVKHYSANATDFESGIPFRFQASEKIGNYQGFFGNVDHRLSLATASKVTLGEAMACSSCFPGGFEPLVFPDDFALANTEDGKKMKEKYGSFGIMDGGCVDNQGIEAILLVEERMRKKEKARKDKAIDLVLISDVTSPYMKGYKPFTGSLPRFIRKLTLKRIGNWLWLFSGLFAVALIVALLYHLFLPSVISGVLFAVVGTMTVLFHWGKKELTKVLNGTFVKHAVPDLMNLSLGNIATMVANRATSLVILITSVFMKHIRRKEYASIYVDPGWANRSITNAIYELRPDELWESRLKNKSLPDFLKPSAQMQQVSAKATGMALSLWFTEKDKADNMPKTIIAAGQFTTCFNLLDYLDKLKASSWNVSERIEELKACETQLREMWEKFRENPYWLVDSVID